MLDGLANANPNLGLTDLTKYDWTRFMSCFGVTLSIFGPKCLIKKNNCDVDVDDPDRRPCVYPLNLFFSAHNGFVDRWNGNCDWCINQQCVDQCGDRPEMIEMEENNDDVDNNEARPLLAAGPAQQQMRFDDEDEMNDRILQCTICLNGISRADDMRTLPCQHKFHFACVGRWVEQHATCPTCRAVIPRPHYAENVFDEDHRQ